MVDEFEENKNQSTPQPNIEGQHMPTKFGQQMNRLSQLIPQYQFPVVKISKIFDKEKKQNENILSREQQIEIELLKQFKQKKGFFKQLLTLKSTNGEFNVAADQ